MKKTIGSLTVETSHERFAGCVPAVFLVLFSLTGFLFSSCATQAAAQAEEYFSIGMAYYEMGKYADAEKWLNRASAADRTMSASDYNLGRIAFETGRYEEAARRFERILVKDPNNVMALKAAAYSRIKNGDLELAEALYNRVLALVPDSADDGFNYALVLYSLKKYDNCEETLNKYPYALEQNQASLLLLARAQKAQNKVEAVDTYAKWMTVNTGTANPQGIYEYAQVLENASLYARALEQYKAAIAAITQDTDTLKKCNVRFEEARLLLTADPDNSDGLSELNTAVTEGFADTQALQALLDDERITQANRDQIKTILGNVQDALNNAQTAAAAAATTASTDTTTDTTATTDTTNTDNNPAPTDQQSGDQPPDTQGNTGDTTQSNN